MSPTSPFAPGLPLSSDPVAHLARRVSYGATPTLQSEIRAAGIGPWIDAQLAPQSVSDTACDQSIDTHLSWTRLSTAELNAASGGQAYKGGDLLVRASVVRQVFSRRVLLETLVDTLSDHLYVAAPGKASAWVGAYDTEVLRRYAMGRFADLLHASATHPAMLVYIDNWLSSKDSPNENYGRELLELHTVGTGQYTEADVRQCTLLLTGHGLTDDLTGYRFDPAKHHVGPIAVMGFTHPNAMAGDGPAALRAFTDHLARHRATATRLCRRLAVRLVSDSPSTALVEELVGVYLANDTDLRPVLRRLLTHADFTAAVGAKWRRPQEWLAAMVRLASPTFATSGTQSSPWTIAADYLRPLEAAGHLPRAWPAVDGYPDQAGEWLSSAGLLAEWDAARAIAEGWTGDIRWQPWTKVLGIAAGQGVWDVTRRMTSRLTGHTWAQADLDVIAMSLAGRASTPPPTGATLTADQVTQLVPETVRQVLASPYFLLR